jgi:hypothetical protein
MSKWKRVEVAIRRGLGLRSGRPPFTGRYYLRARRLLLDAIDILNAAGLPYTVDAGTLLGIARQGDLIPWDNDIDMLLPVEQAANLQKLAWRFRLRGWGVSRLYRMAFRGQAWNIGDPRVLKIRRRHLMLFGGGNTLLDITFIYRHGDHYYWPMAKKVCRAPCEFFAECDLLEYAGRRVRAPHDHERYLELSYGDWRTPRQDFSHDQLGVIVADSDDG